MANKKVAKKVITPEMVAMLKACGDTSDKAKWENAWQDFAYFTEQALVSPLKDGVMPGDNHSGLYEDINLEPGAAPEFGLSFLTPGTERDYVAYTVPSIGAIPQRNIIGDYIMVPTYEVANSIDWPLKYARDARWDIASKAQEVMEEGVVMKDNKDAFRTLLTAGYGRGITVYDSDATAGLFTKRLISLLQTSMTRYAGGNATSVNRGRLSRVYISPEGLQDIRSWDLTQVDDMTRRQIFLAGEGEAMFSSIFGVELVELLELGVGQEYQNYIVNTLGLSMPGSKLEIVIGVDLQKNDSFVHPIREPLRVFPDTTMHRQARAGLYCRKEAGWAVLDARRVLIGAF